MIEFLMMCVATCTIIYTLFLLWASTIYNDPGYLHKSNEKRPMTKVEISEIPCNDKL